MKLLAHHGLKRIDVIKFLAIRTTGNFILLFALTGIAMTFGDALLQEGIYRLNDIRGVEYTVAQEATPETNGFAQADVDAVPITPVDTDFAVVIPKINANAAIIPNVDPGNQAEYSAALKKGVAHAAGSVFPGMDGNVYLFAHSTDYFWNISRFNAVFYLLKELEPGDEIDIFFGGRRYIYTVTERKITNPEDTQYLENNIGGEPRLTLQTCWPPGTTIKRLVVFAKPKAS
jgi:LPXTG-site transpeptidase (sortase) family protein